MQRTKYFSFSILCFLMSMLLTACGSKGDLYQVEQPNSANKVLITAPQQNTQYSAQYVSQHSFSKSTKVSKKKLY